MSGASRRSRTIFPYCDRQSPDVLVGKPIQSAPGGGNTTGRQRNLCERSRDVKTYSFAVVASFFFLVACNGSGGGSSISAAVSGGDTSTVVCGSGGFGGDGGSSGVGGDTGAGGDGGVPDGGSSPGVCVLLLEKSGKLDGADPCIADSDCSKSGRYCAAFCCAAVTHVCSPLNRCLPLKGHGDFCSHVDGDHECISGKCDTTADTCE